MPITLTDPQRAALIERINVYKLAHEDLVAMCDSIIEDWVDGFKAETKSWQDGDAGGIAERRIAYLADFKVALESARPDDLTDVPKILED